MCAKLVQDLQTRQQIASVAARIMVQEGVKDYQIAKNKAASQLNITNKRNLPNNSEIEAEIMLYQRLFKADTQPQILKALRETAIKAMQLFADFQPRLVGEVLAGTATQHSDIVLHLFTDNPEDIVFYLMEQGIPHEVSEKRFKLPQQQIAIYPLYHFIAGDERIVLIVFNTSDIRWSPLSPVDGKPMQRANLKAVEKLLADSEI